MGPDLSAQASVVREGLAQPDIVKETRPDGSFVLRSRMPLLPYRRSVIDWLVHWATLTPDVPFLAERIRRPGQSASWRVLTYADALRHTRSIGQALLELRVAPQRPVTVLSDNSINHALMTLAAMLVGRPSATVSPAYARVAKDMTKLHGILKQLDPALVYVEDGDAYGHALAAAPINCPVIATIAPKAGWLPFDTLLSTAAGADVDAAYARIAPGDIAKLLLTSGSTGKPKLVINTHGMLSANQQMIAQCWPFIDGAAPVVVDWLPWSHTFGANHNFNLVLCNGGTLYATLGRRCTSTCRAGSMHSRRFSKLTTGSPRDFSSACTCCFMPRPACRLLCASASSALRRAIARHRYSSRPHGVPRRLRQLSRACTIATTWPAI